MRVAVIGSRTFNDYEKMKTALGEINVEGIREIEEIVSGGAKGADSLGARYAREHGLKLTEFIPDWKKYGMSAGFVRNKFIVDNCDMVVAFWDGESRGTKDSIDYARKTKKEIEIILF